MRRVVVSSWHCHRRVLSTAAGPLPPKDGVDWDNIGFKLNRTEKMYLTEGGPGTFDKGKVAFLSLILALSLSLSRSLFFLAQHLQIVPYGGISLEPAATVLNYGQGLFEGMKGERQL